MNQDQLRRLAEKAVRRSVVSNLRWAADRLTDEVDNFTDADNDTAWWAIERLREWADAAETLEEP